MRSPYKIGPHTRRDSEPTEEDVRRALAAMAPSPSHPVRQHHPEHGPHRRRFVRDGEVPVVVLHARRDSNEGTPSVSAATGNPTGMDPTGSALRAERRAHEQAERKLREALATIHSLQTRLAHAEMAHGEALAAERQAREQAEQAARDATMAREEVERRLSVQTEISKPTRLVRRHAKAPAATSDEDEAQPIEWWVPGWRDRI